MIEVNLGEKLKGLLTDYAKQLDVSLEKALDRCAELYIEDLERTAPRQVGESDGKPYHQCFAVRETVKNRYVGNTKTVKGKDGAQIPLINLLEFGRGPERTGARPHMNQSLQRVAEQMLREISEKLEGVK